MLCVRFIFIFIVGLYQNKVNGQVSCAHLKQEGNQKDGIKIINPEEIGGSGDVVVECDMTSDPSDGITVIHHDNEGRTLVHGSSFVDKGSYSRKISYNDFTMEQIKQLVKKSASCEQYIKLECHGSVIWHASNYDTPFTWWASRDNVNMYMWGGGKSYKKTCACGLNGTCVRKDDRCNCDSNDRQLRSDGGFLTDRHRLPVTEIYIGDCDSPTEYSFHTLGPLKCKGIAPPVLHSCAEVKAAGFTKTDSYLLDPDGDGGDNAYWAYCDLDNYEENEKSVTTVVFHDVPDRTHVTGYANPRYKQVLTYPVSDTELRILTETSSYCRQYVDIDCIDSIISDSSWFSINGNEMQNWGGDSTTSESCPCSLTGSCSNNAHSCNCQMNDNVWREDSGYIVMKEELPVKEIHVGDTDSSNEEVYFTIGPLECTGPVPKTITRGSSCYKVKTETVTWQKAVGTCQRMNAHLVTINDDEERVYLQKLTQALVGPMSSMWYDVQCSTIDTNLNVSCDALFGYICESELFEYKSFKRSNFDKSPPANSLLTSSKLATSSGVCSLYCEQTTNCNSFSYNSNTHGCKISTETTDLNAVLEDGFEFYILKTTYDKCSIRF